MSEPTAASNYNPRPSIDKIINQLQGECYKVRDWDGNRTKPIRIWILRRTLEYLIELKDQTP